MMSDSVRSFGGTTTAQQIQTRLFGTEVSLELDTALMAYWTVLLRLVMGWYFLFVGLQKYTWAFAAEPFDAAG